MRAGAWGGYELLWLILVAVVTKSLLTLYLLGRYAVVSGEPVAARLVELPGPRGWFLWTILVLEGIVAPFVFVVIAVPCGRLLAGLVGEPDAYRWIAAVFVTGAIGVAARQKYETLERSQIVVCLVLLVGTLVATALARPDLGAIASGLVRFGSIPPYPEWVPESLASRSRFLEMASVFGYAGSIGLNYVVYADWVRVKGWTAAADRSLREALEPLRWDVGLNAGVIFLVTGAFLVAGAAVLHPLERVPSGFDLLTEQAAIFSRLSPAIVPLYYVTILAALWGTLNSLPDIYARGAHGFLRALVPAARDLDLRIVMRVFCLVTLPLTWIFIWRGTAPIVMVDLVALFSTNLSVALVAFAGIWLDRQLPAERRASPWLLAAAVVSAVVIGGMSVLSAREVVAGYL